MQLKKPLLNPRFFDYDFQLDQTVGKTETFDPTRQSDSCIGNVKKSRRLLVRVSHTTRHKRQTTPHDNIGNAGLAAVTSAAARREVSVLHPYLRPSAARDSTRWPQRAVSMTFFASFSALAAALAILEDIQRRDGLEDEMEENAPRLKLTRCSRKKQDISLYVCGWAQVLL